MLNAISASLNPDIIEHYDVHQLSELKNNITVTKRLCFTHNQEIDPKLLRFERQVNYWLARKS